jgi:two-component system sensor histidine kinase KdpD
MKDEFSGIKMITKIIKKSFPVVSRILAAVLLILATKLLLQPVQSFLKIQIIELIYLLPVLLATVLWGLTPGIIASFTAFLVFNYFYIEPYNTLLVHEIQDIITLIIFLFVAVILSQFIGKAREGIRLARLREWEATRMYELISSLSSLKDSRSIAQDLAQHTLQTFQFDFIEITIKNNVDDFLETASSNGDRLPGPPKLMETLETARGVEGEVHVWYSRAELTSQETRLLKAFNDQGTLALERVRLTKGETRMRILEESDQLKTSLLNSVSHELRTPLSVIKASVSSLRSGTVNWNMAARQDLLATIEEETDLLNLLVGNLLDMSRIESGVLKIKKEWNSIDEIAMGAATKIHKHLANHLLEMHFAENLPLIPTDFVMIGQVFMNLIGNSIKYAPADSTISINCRQVGDCLDVKVANQGPPVPEQHLDRIFEKFYRVTAAEQITGTGLGLSICKGIVEAHGGKIWAENEKDHFVFHFMLPTSLDGTLPKTPEEIPDE